MKGIRQHPKAVVCLVILVLAAAGLLIVRDIPGHIGDGATEDSDSDEDTTDDGIWWYVEVDDVTHNSSSTESYHRYEVENGSDFEIRLTFEFAHRVLTGAGGPVYNADGSLKEDVIRCPWAEVGGLNCPAPELDPGDEDANWWWLCTSIDDLDEGSYKIHAYTDLGIYRASPESLLHHAYTDVDHPFKI